MRRLPRLTAQEQHDAYDHVHRYYQREMGERLPFAHATTVVLVVAGLIEYLTQDEEDDG